MSKAAEKLPVPRLDNPKHLPPSVNAAEALSGLPEARIMNVQKLPRNLPMPYSNAGPVSRFAEYMRRPCVSEVSGNPSLP